VNSFEKIQAVFDCNTYLQSVVRRNSPAGLCFQLAEKRIIKLFIGKDVLAELEDVLNRPHIRERFVNLTDERIEEFLGSLKKIATFVRNIPKVFSLPRDVDDEVYINLAVEAEADFIVTRDRDLIDLMSDYDIESKMFRRKFRPLKIVQPLEFLQIVKDKIKERNKNQRFCYQICQRQRHGFGECERTFYEGDFSDGRSGYAEKYFSVEHSGLADVV
jgi:putative PIN family toxin of toxin-antitoxin system